MPFQWELGNAFSAPIAVLPTGADRRVRATITHAEDFQSRSTRPQMTSDPDVATAALHAAGQDCEALNEAIAAAAFLDKIPGDHRQKLRGRSIDEEEGNSSPYMGKWPSLAAQFSCTILQ